MTELDTSDSRASRFCKAWSSESPVACDYNVNSAGNTHEFSSWSCAAVQRWIKKMEALLHDADTLNTDILSEEDIDGYSFLELRDVRLTYRIIAI